MKLWPEPSSTVVSARRVDRAGISKPLSLIAPSDVSSDTSGRTRIEMRPPSSKVGVKIGRAHVRTPVTNAHLVCRLLLEQKKKRHNKSKHKTLVIHEKI